MDAIVARYKMRILEICPNLNIERIALNQEGLVNDIIIINDNTVFRFAKDEQGVKALEAERRILDLIRPHATLAIPTPFHVGRDVMAYPFVAGETFSRRVLSSLDEQALQEVADQLASFLRTLHSPPMDDTMPLTSAPVRYEDWIRIRQGIRERVYRHLMAHQIEWAEALFASILDGPRAFHYESRLIHGDLGCYHILFDRKTNRLSGIIDFGVAGVGDPANDIAVLIQYYGESFVRKLLVQYPAMHSFLKRARFYSQALELQWALRGVTTGDTLWFLAHLGGARDVIE